MRITIQQTEKLLRGNYSFRQLAFSLLITRWKSNYAKAPTQTTVEQCAAEINTFLKKYNTMMAEDIAVIKKL